MGRIAVGHGNALRIKTAVLLCIVSHAFAILQAQDQTYPPKKPVPTEIFPQLFVIGNHVVAEQWKVTLGLVNGPTDLKQAEPGQCVRFAVLVSGDDRDRVVASGKLAFDFGFAGRAQNFAAELPGAVKQVKPEGGDFVTDVLAAAGIKNPMPSGVSIAASRAEWCVPLDAQDGIATIQSSVVAPDGKSVALKPRSVDVKTFETARKNAPFRDVATFGPWLQRYHNAPDPAELLPGLRIIASDEKFRLMPNIMTFFVEALKTSPAAAQELIHKLPTEDRSVQIYSIPLLSEAGYDTASLLGPFRDDEKTLITAIHLPDPYDLKPDQALPGKMDMLWAIFFATGRLKPVRTIASMLAWRADYDKFEEMRKSGRKPSAVTESIMRGVVYSGAGWSLNALSRNDGVIMDFIDALRASPDTPADVKAELASLYTNPAFTRK